MTCSIIIKKLAKQCAPCPSVPIIFLTGKNINQEGRRLVLTVLASMFTNVLCQCILPSKKAIKFVSLVFKISCVYIYSHEYPALSLISSVAPSLKIKKSILQFLECFGELSSTPKVTIFQEKLSTKLDEPASSNAIS